MFFQENGYSGSSPIWVVQQNYGIDYHERFATVARNSYRFFLALAAIFELSVFQFDIKTAFYMAIWTKQSIPSAVDTFRTDPVGR
jgi:hypothetical protein